MKKLIMFLMLITFVSGCASYRVMDEKGQIVSQGEAEGFLRTIEVTEKYDSKTGKLIMRIISTKSNTGEILKIVNELIDTTVDSLSKIKP